MPLDSGRFNKHIDTWDAVENQRYLSLEAVRHLFGQLLTFSTAPKLDSPAYTVLKKLAGYEVRKYGMHNALIRLATPCKSIPSEEAGFTMLQYGVDHLTLEFAACKSHPSTAGADACHIAVTVWAT